MDEKRREQEKALEKLSPFQLKDRLIRLAKEHHERMMLNAGRGNPNWTAVTARQAFFQLGMFTVLETSRTSPAPGMGGHVEAKGMLKRFHKFHAAHQDDEGVSLLDAALDYVNRELGIDSEEFLHEMVCGILADSYPTPDRMLKYCEKVSQKYLIEEMCAGDASAGQFDLFATEGGTAAMCYIFNSLLENKLLNKGDKVALGTPIFTPYLEIPHLNDYELLEIEIAQDEHLGWQVPDEEIDKLADPDIKAFFLVNPGNPSSVSLQESTLARIADLIKTKRQDLILLTDDVYGTFVPGFRSLMATCPENTICVYSYSKYFGATGWRLGVIAICEDNVFDKKIAALSQADKDALNERYGSVSLNVPGMKLIDRMVADSRAVALNHTAGLSTPQQVQMALFSLFNLLDEKQVYKADARKIVIDRFNELYRALGVKHDESPMDAHYYTTIDLIDLATERYGKEFAEWLPQNYEPVDYVLKLAEEKEVVLLPGAGFDAPDWSVRVSLANLPGEAYPEIGRLMIELLDEYRDQWQAEAKG